MTEPGRDDGEGGGMTGWTGMSERWIFTVKAREGRDE
jgi:hypothetical protein